MLHKAQTVEALARNRDAFVHEQVRWSHALARYRVALSNLGSETATDLCSRLSGNDAPGALPSKELDGGLIVPFEPRWANAEEARSWAMSVLTQTTTVGVDGSQLLPSKEFGVPAGLVQVAWFVNPHDDGLGYVKDVRVEVVAGPDLSGYNRRSTSDERPFVTEPINQRRFSLEMEEVTRFLRTLPSVPPPLGFLDGSLIVSFASQMRRESLQAYVRPVVEAISASTANRIPLAGYIDTSYARDLVQMIDCLWPAVGVDGAAPFVYDAELVQDSMKLFDRTASFICARGDVLSSYISEGSAVSYEDQVCFLYLRTSAHAAPSRIEFPRWLLETGLVDRVTDIVRAEVIIGAGFPYALESADAAAVLSTQDRMAFYKLFENFAAEYGLSSGATGKMSSKRRRR